MSELYKCPVCGRAVSSTILVENKNQIMFFKALAVPVFEWHRTVFMYGDKCPASLQPIAPQVVHSEEYRMGFLAGRRFDQEPEDNPYQAGTRPAADWDHGYSDGGEDWLNNTRLADKLLSEAL